MVIGWSVVLLVAGAALAASTASAAATVALGQPVVLDGPSQGIASLGGVAVARDGSGGLVYVKNVAGVPHVFVSRLAGGLFGAPEQVDTGLAPGSSQPVIAAGGRGLLLVAFINGGSLYVVDRGSSGSRYGAPVPIASGAINPAISISAFGKAYLAFTATGAGGHDIRVAYYHSGAWALESSPLDAVPAHDAGMGAARPAVATAGDGVGIVAWGEAGHVYSRKVWATSPSVVFEQADVPTVGSFTEVSADQPAVGVGGDSSFADVIFHERVAKGVSQQDRVLLRRLRGSRYEAVYGADGLASPGPEGADRPRIATDEYGRGLATSERTNSNDLVAMLTLATAFPGPIERVDTLHNTGRAYAVPARAGLQDGLIAWQQTPGTAGAPEIRARFLSGSGLGPELIVSSLARGSVSAANGLDAAGDIAADVAIAWVQETGAGAEIVTGQLYQPPGAARPHTGARYSRTSRPVLTWSAPRELWPPLRYLVSVEGTVVGQTDDVTSLPVQLAEGPHRWSVTALNRAGLQSTSATARLWVDTVAPAVTLRIAGRTRVGTRLHASVSYTDSPPPEPPADASGIASAIIRWGDRTSEAVRHARDHSYQRAGRYTITVVVTDRAGNRTKVRKTIRIRPAQPIKPKGKHK